MYMMINQVLRSHSHVMIQYDYRFILKGDKTIEKMRRFKTFASDLYTWQTYYL